MTTAQKVIHYLAIAFAIFLIVSIFGSILNAVGLLNGFFLGDAVMEEVQTYAVSPSIVALDIEINAADFTIKQADAFSIESNVKNLTVKEQDGVLIIKEKKKFGATYTEAALTLYIPKDITFEKAEITTGAGRFTADTLSANALKLVLGAGEVFIGRLTVTSAAEIDGGAGKITVADGVIRNLEFEMGVGQLNLCATILGDSEFDFGVGESNITLIGNKKDYRITAEKGIGSITVDGEKASNLIGSESGENRIDLNGGIGAIKLNFQESMKQ